MAPASFLTQADALFRKNLTFHNRNIKMNASLVMFPAFLCVVIIAIRTMVNSQLDNADHMCGCKCVKANGSGTCQNICGIEYSTFKQSIACSISSPQEWPPLFLVPSPPFRAVKTDSHSFADLPDSSCLSTRTCPVTSLFTSQNRSIAESIISGINVDAAPQKTSYKFNQSYRYLLGTESKPGSTIYIEPAVLSKSPIHALLPHCSGNINLSIPVDYGSDQIQKNVDCVESLYAWRASSSLINNELHQGFWGENSTNEIHEYLAAYDFLNTSSSRLDVHIWYNSSYRNLLTDHLLGRVPRSINMVSNAFIRHFKNKRMGILLEFTKEMPRTGKRITLNLTIIGPLLYAWVIQLLFPVMVASLVYEKQHKLKFMMKIHGLGDAPYWLISYSYFLVISSLYMMWFIFLGSLIGLEIFTLNSYGVQLIFYFVYLNLQIAFAFLASIGFTDTKTATAVSYVYVFGSGLMGDFFFKSYVEDMSFSRRLLMTMELLPGFSLYNGLYELSQYALEGRYKDTFGMTWTNLSNHDNGMQGTLIVMSLEWLILLFIAYPLDQLVSSGIVRYTPCSLVKFWNTRKQTQNRDVAKHNSTFYVDTRNKEVSLERHKVKELLSETNKIHPFVCHNLRKVYMRRDGSPKKLAVRSLSLAVQCGECFGLLGPNGSGKTTIINMVTGFLSPTSGSAFVGGLDIRLNIDHIYTKVGICPQEDLIWEELTGREHLLFYGRLRNLKGKKLMQEIDTLLNMVNLFKGNVSNQHVGTYSGGMKRSLSVAISLIGDAQVVFMDEPTTGLDPKSRSNLWEVIKAAKEKRAIILTTHSMEEAEFLCDRIGIMVKGSLQCLGSAKELKRRYSVSYVLTISTNQTHEEEVRQMISALSQSTKRIYNVAGTQKFRLLKKDVQLSDIFQAMANIRRQIPVDAFDVTDSSLEDVFFNVVQGTSSIEEDTSLKTISIK